MPLLFAILISAVVVCIVSYSLFTYESGNAPDTTPPLPRRDMVRALCWGVGAFCWATLTLPLGFFPFLWRPRGKAPTSRPGVVLIHGLYHTPGAWIIFAPALAMAGLGRSHALGYNSFGTRSFEDIATRLIAQVHAILDDTPRIALVGHSMGGLFIRRLLADPRIARATVAAVTLGAPHHGSKMAALAFCSTVGRQLLPVSPLFPALAARPEAVAVHKLNIVSPADDMVLPNASSAMTGEGWTTWHTPPMSHVALLYHPAVIRQTAAFLKKHVP
ncbi:alpha/beta fold hydrolase [Desulfovibrio sulfodismutans]|uniref:Alpha/beta fold hydrolase n=1 Tax=Desulfolutivibrio sulfodismutans TaxID=63561 RepID=A0A7K3NL27_9BACT|nr:alpha/beta fold hydrolase [Desulfolutivibrio sulfodismutans]NDY56817.1 alpha/beta fold hydrolase [Desulfolutivibrio sulfodismutans]QLA10956.1 alpha/beta fold hydrolase [Desulfolutivibrio sulfodismutans DSM 3696]